MSEIESNGFVFPDFKNSNLEVMNQLASGKGRFTGDREKKIFLLIDGLGYGLLKKIVQRRKAFANTLKKAQVSKGTTIFPSFTLSVIPTIDSGLNISENGMVGETFPIRETGRIANIFSRFDENEREIVYPKPDNIKKIAKRCRFAYMTTEHVINTSYTATVFKDLTLIPHISFHDMIIQLYKAVKEEKYDFIYAYSDMIDHAQHTYASASFEVEELLEAAFVFMEKLLIPLLKERGYNLIITSDHGHMDFKKDSIVGIRPEGGIMGYMTSYPWGSPRALFMNAINGKEKQFEEAFEKHYGKNALLFNVEEALKSGLFGDTYPNNSIRYRFGTHIAIAKGTAFFHYIKPGDKKRFSETFGHHSGMSAEEMEIPIIIY
jgi:hypothetical protein